MPKRILVSGGNGFVGRELVRALYDTHEVCVIDNLRSGPVRFRTSEMDRFRLARSSITDADAVAALMADFAPDVIIHLAAIHYIPECEQFPLLATTTNIDGTVNLLANAPEGARFVFASSGAVYKPDSKPHIEQSSILLPSDVYGFTKLHGEHYVKYFTEQRGLSSVVVRLFNVVGPGETNPHLLPEVVAQLKAGHKVLKLGNTWPKRDYIHVQDAARGFATVALGETDSTCVTVNLGTSRAYSVDEILEKLQRIGAINFTLEQEASRVRRVDRAFLAADMSEMQRMFRWLPRATVDDALADLWTSPDLSPELMAKYECSRS